MQEILKQALEALEFFNETAICSADTDISNEAITSLRQAIAELESQEPVAWMHIMDNTEGIKANGAGIVSITQKRKHPFGKVGIDFSKSYLVTSTPLYTHPPQREWVRLTNKELQPIADAYRILFGSWVEEFAREIEAKLKEKNS